MSAHLEIRPDIHFHHGENLNGYKKRAGACGADEISKYFRHHIRSFNSVFAMTSIGVHEAEIPGYGPPTFKIQGMIHHRIGSLLPLDNQPPRFMQIYFYDNDDAITYRLSRLQILHNQDLAKEIVNKIEDIIKAC